MEELCDTFSRGDFTHIRYTTSTVVYLIAEVVLLRFAVHLLDRAVSFFFFAWSAG